MSGKEYNGNKVAMSLNAIPLDSGYADGEFLSIEFDSDGFTKVVGTDGEVVFSPSNDKSGTITLKFLQTSAANRVLSGLYALQLANGGSSVFNMTDLSNGEEFVASQCVIAKLPPVSMDREATSREWKLIFAEGLYVHLATG